MAVDRAYKFYSIMTVLIREMESGLMDTDSLIKTIVNIAPFPFHELSELRDKYLYNITPWDSTLSTTYSDDDDDSTDEDDEKVAVSVTHRVAAVFRPTQRKYSLVRAKSPISSAKICSPTSPDRDNQALDISVLKQQYTKLRERQSKSDIILTATHARQTLGPSVPTPASMNHLQLGKSALHSVRCRRGATSPETVPHPANTASKSAPKPRRGRQQLDITPQGQLSVASNVKIILPQLQEQWTLKLYG
jgi:hypothetical protein